MKKIISAALALTLALSLTACAGGGEKNTPAADSDMAYVKNNGKLIVGITDFAQSELGDLVFINLPQEGDDVTADEAFCDVESVKAVSDVVSPVTGVVEEANTELEDEPQKLNEDPYGAWIAKIKDISAFGELLSAEEYEAFIERK